MDKKKDKKNFIRESLFVSVDLLIQGKSKVDELVESLEDSGLDKKDAQKAAADILNYRKNFLKTLSKEFDKLKNTKGKNSITDIERMLEEASKKIDD